MRADLPGSTHSTTRVNNEQQLIILIHLLKDEKSFTYKEKCLHSAIHYAPSDIHLSMFNFTNSILFTYTVAYGKCLTHIYLPLWLKTILKHG